MVIRQITHLLAVHKLLFLFTIEARIYTCYY